MVVTDEIVEEWIKSLETFDKNRVQQLYNSSPSLLWHPLPFNKSVYPHFMTHLSNQDLLKNITIDHCYSIQFLLILIYEKEATININAKEIVTFLLEMCEVADLNTFYWGSTKNTTLHLACNLGQISIIRQLIKHGVSIDVLNEDDLSPIDFAISTKVMDILRESISNNNNNSNNIDNNMTISKKLKEDNSNNSNRFEKLRQFAEDSSNSSSSALLPSSSSLSLPASVQRQNSTKKYVQPGHIETRKRQVLQQTDDQDTTNNNNKNSGSINNKIVKKEAIDTQKSSKFNTTNKRLQEVESLAKQSRVKNNPLFKKFEQQQQEQANTMTATPVGKRSLKIPNLESIQDRRISKGITSLKDRSYVSASVFRQKDESSSASKENLKSPTSSSTATATTVKNNDKEKQSTIITTTITSFDNQPMDNSDYSIIVTNSDDEQQTSSKENKNVKVDKHISNELQPIISEEEKNNTIENNKSQDDDVLMEDDDDDEESQPTIILEEKSHTVENSKSQDNTPINDSEFSTHDNDDNGDDDESFNIIDNYAELDTKIENNIDDKNIIKEKIIDLDNNNDNNRNVTISKADYLEDNNDSDNKSNKSDDDDDNKKEKFMDHKNDEDDISNYNTDIENNENEINPIHDQKNTSTTTQLESDSTTTVNNKRISALRMSHLSIASNSTDGEQWFDSYEDNADNETRKSVMLANINNYYQKKKNDNDNDNDDDDDHHNNSTPRQSFMPPNYDPNPEQYNHPDSASASTYRYSRGSEESHATFKFQSYDHSDTESSNTWPPPSPTKIESIQRIRQVTIQNNIENNNNEHNNNNNTIKDHDVDSMDDDDNSIYEEQLQQQQQYHSNDKDSKHHNLNDQINQTESKIESPSPQQQSSLPPKITKKNRHRYSQKEDKEEPTGHVIVATQSNFVVHRLSHFQRMYDDPSSSSLMKDKTPMIKEAKEDEDEEKEKEKHNDDYVQTKTEIQMDQLEHRFIHTEQQYNSIPDQHQQYQQYQYSRPSQEQNYPILPLIPEAASSGYGKLYVRLSCAQDILLPIPLETTYVRCVISDGFHEYVSRYEVFNNKVNFQYECTVDTHPDMIITIALQVRPDPHVKPLTGLSRLFTTIQRQKKTLLGYVHPEDFIVGQSRFALSHMVHACDQKTYHANFDCFNSWFTRSAKEKKRLAHSEDGQVLKVVGNLAVDLLYLPVSDPSMKIPNTLQECDLALKIRQWHGTCWRTGYLSTRPKGETAWKRYYFQLIGSQLLGYRHENDIQNYTEHYNMTEAIQLTVAAEQVLVDVNKMKNNIPTNDDSIPFNYSKNTICKDNRRGFFRITFKGDDYIDCVCDHVKESELWVNTFRAMIGKVPLTVSSSVFLN